MKLLNLITLSLVLGLILFFVSCQSEQVGAAVDCAATDLTVEGATTETTCGVSSGTISVTANGGFAPYDFELVGIGVNGIGTFSDLSAGNYTINVTDGNGCSVSIQLLVASPNGPSLTGIQTTEAGCGTSFGTIAASANGGQPPYSFSINGGSARDNGSFAGLSTGSYELMVRDAEGCETVEQLSVLSGVTLTDDVQPIINNNCAVSGCHNGTQSPNLSSMSGIVGSASRIRVRTTAGTMPPTGSLAQSQVDAITCWVEDGAQNN
ncbi:MAG: hypothetical protein ACJAZM_002552 [Cyclobacteriaceae bacterium]|jgi:hypothetical protein